MLILGNDCYDDDVSYVSDDVFHTTAMKTLGTFYS